MAEKDKNSSFGKKMEVAKTILEIAAVVIPIVLERISSAASRGK